LSSCGAGQETFYYPREFSKKRYRQKPSQVLPRECESQRNLKTAHLNNSSSKWQATPTYARSTLLITKVAVPVKEGTQFFANGREVESIVLAKGFYTRTLPDNSSMRFSLEGRISYIYDKNGNFLKFDYDKDSIKEVVDNNGRRLSFKFYSNKKVKSIVGPNGITARV
jgi:hypothetical protein